MWDERYAQPGFAYGTEPNEFLAEVAGHIPDGPVLSLGEALGMRVIAEGIETAEQRAELLRLGCDAGQGYAFAPPLPPDDLADFITRSNTPAP